MVNRDGSLVEVEWTEALDIVANRIDLIKAEDGGAAFGVIGGAQGTNEDAYALPVSHGSSSETNNVDSRLDDSLASHFLAATVDRALISDLDSATPSWCGDPTSKRSTPPSTCVRGGRLRSWG